VENLFEYDRLGEFGVDEIKVEHYKVFQDADSHLVVGVSLEN
jgi:hypothetical protein